MPLTDIDGRRLGDSVADKLGNRNLIINGAMLVAQRGTSSTISGYGTVDRFTHEHGGTDEAPTFARVDVSSSDTPYSLGFRRALKATNGNQTSGAGASDYVGIGHRIEAQFIANSGWNHTSSSSYITLTFWAKSSVAKSFKGYFRTDDGTAQIYPFDTGTLSANTWTKVTKTIPGNSNITINIDRGLGLELFVYQFLGTDYTDSSVTENAWAAYASGTRTPDDDSSWYTTDEATFEITGVQLEIGNTATPFEHRSFADELIRCKRYFEKSYNADAAPGTATSLGALQWQSNGATNSIASFPVQFSVLKRGTPTIVIYNPTTGASGSLRCQNSTNQAAQSYNVGHNGFAFRTTSGATTNQRYLGHYTADVEI